MMRDADFPRIGTDSVAEFRDADGNLWHFPVWMNFGNRKFIESDSGMLLIRDNLTIEIQGTQRMCAFTRYRKKSEAEAAERAAVVAAPKPEPVDDRLHVEKIASESQWQAARRAAERRAQQALNRQRAVVREVQK